MLTITSRRTAIAALAAAALAAAAPGVAAAKSAGPTHAGSHTTTMKLGSAARQSPTSPLGGIHGLVKGVTSVALQAGATGDGPLGEEACERLGELADNAYTKGDKEVSNGNVPAAEDQYEYANGLVDYGLDNGCFIVY